MTTFDLTGWTLPMAVAWITWRDFDAVQSQMPTSSSLSELLLSQELDEEGMTTFQARRELWHALLSSQLTADGIDSETRRRVQIPPMDWRDLDYRDDVKRPNSVRHFDCKGAIIRTYSDVIVLRKDVVRLWPDEQAQDAISTRPDLSPVEFSATVQAATVVPDSLWSAEPSAPAALEPVVNAGAENPKMAGNDRARALSFLIRVSVEHGADAPGSRITGKELLRLAQAEDADFKASVRTAQEALARIRSKL